jgi:hypothetical protein
MKIKLKLPNGAELDFDGDSGEFDRVLSFLATPPEVLTAPAAELSEDIEGNRGDDGGSDDSGGGGGGGADPGDSARAGGGALEPAHVNERLMMVGAKSDIERVTVISQLAVEAGMAGADYPTVEQLYTELGFRKPSRFTKAVANAKSRNLVRTVGQGIWKPTYLGENYARGLGRATTEPAHRRATQRPQLSLHAGGEDDA